MVKKSFRYKGKNLQTPTSTRDVAVKSAIYNWQSFEDLPSSFTQPHRQRESKQGSSPDERKFNDASIELRDSSGMVVACQLKYKDRYRFERVVPGRYTLHRFALVTPAYGP
jgi:hypothetical protein